MSRPAGWDPGLYSPVGRVHDAGPVRDNRAPRVGHVYPLGGVPGRGHPPTHSIHEKARTDHADLLA